MANQQQLDLLKQGSDAWNEWRKAHPKETPNLTFAVLSSADLSGADLSGADLSDANLSGAVLSDANLSDANLSGADLVRADLFRADLFRAVLSSANLSGAGLSSANLSGANLSGANLSGAGLSGADLSRADLFRAVLFRANLSDANLSEADLSGASLVRADLFRANLSGAGLSRANLIGANLSGAVLSGAVLSGAVLSGADLSGADLSRATLVSTRLTKATLTSCRIYGISAWDVHLEGATQSNLVITSLDQPTITVDHLEVAQFIYLLLNNTKIRQVIDTISKKVVLILGRFTPERKAVLDALREALRTYDYLPVVFDFDKPSSQDLLETVSTLAHLSRFVIADLTDPSSVAAELATIVPHCIVPIQPILVQDDTQSEYALFHVLPRRYDWVLQTLRYQDSDSLLASLKARIIDPAERKAQELEKR